MSAKIKRSLIILIGILILLVAIISAVIISSALKSNSEKISSPAFTVTDPVRISFGPNGNESEYISDNGIWYSSERADIPIKQTCITQILNLLPELYAKRTIEPVDALSSYGLDPAAYILTLTDSDGTAQTLMIGSSAGDAGTYAKYSESSVIIILPSNTKLVSLVASTLTDMIDADAPSSMGESAITEMTVSLNGKSASFKQEDDGWYFLDESGEYIPEENFSAIGSDGESHTVRKYLNDVGDSVSSFKSNGCMGYNCTNDELSEMGLDNNTFTVSIIKTDETEVTYYIGNSFTHTDGSTYYYFTTKDNPAVFRMSEAAVAPFLDLAKVLGK